VVVNSSKFTMLHTYCRLHWNHSLKDLGPGFLIGWSWDWHHRNCSWKIRAVVVVDYFLVPPVLKTLPGGWLNPSLYWKYWNSPEKGAASPRDSVLVALLNGGYFLWVSNGSTLGAAWCLDGVWWFSLDVGAFGTLNTSFCSLLVSSTFSSLGLLTHVGSCWAKISVRRLFSASSLINSFLKLAFWISRTSPSAIRRVVRSFFLFLHLVAATLFLSRRRRLRSSSSTVRSSCSFLMSSTSSLPPSPIGSSLILLHLHLQTFLDELRMIALDWHVGVEEVSSHVLLVATAWVVGWWQWGRNRWVAPFRAVGEWRGRNWVNGKIFRHWFCYFFAFQRLVSLMRSVERLEMLRWNVYYGIQYFRGVGGGATR